MQKIHTKQGLEYPYKIIRKKIKVKDIIHLSEKVESALNHRANQLIQYNWNIRGETYPWLALKESMEYHWNPSYFHCISAQGRRGTLHNEQPGASPFVLLEYEKNGKLLYSPHLANHRMSLIKALNWKEVDAFVKVEDGFTHTNAKELNKFIKYMESILGGCQQYQTLRLPYNVHWPSRDDTNKVFHHVFGWRMWPGRTVLEVGSHIAMMGLTAKRYGAEKVVGFDFDGKLVNLAKELSQILDLPIELHECDFWDFPLWGKEKFDIVMAHQCMYHFNTAHRCANAGKYTQDEMLDRICNATKEIFWTYTFVHDDNKPTREPEGYRPTKSKIIKDISKRNFSNIDIFDFNLSSAKRSVVAHRNESILKVFENGNNTVDNKLLSLPKNLSQIGKQNKVKESKKIKKEIKTVKQKPIHVEQLVEKKPVHTKQDQKMQFDWNTI